MIALSGVSSSRRLTVQANHRTSEDPREQEKRGPRPYASMSTSTPPEVLDALKARLNREGSLPGTAVLTGSTRQDALPHRPALTGRLHAMTI